MNILIVTGRLVREPEKRIAGETVVTKFCIASDRGKDRGADFINCTAFGKLAENIAQYVQKGQRIAVNGRLNIGSYEKDGRKISTADCIVNTAEWEKVKKESTEESAPYMIPESINEDLPFN